MGSYVTARGSRGRREGGGSGMGGSAFATVAYIKVIFSFGKRHTLIKATIHAIVNYDFGKNCKIL